MSNEAATSLRSFVCWEFHAFSVNEHNASCGRTHELLDEALRTERRMVVKQAWHYEKGVWPTDEQADSRLDEIGSAR